MTEILTRYNPSIASDPVLVETQPQNVFITDILICWCPIPPSSLGYHLYNGHFLLTSWHDNEVWSKLFFLCITRIMWPCYIRRNSHIKIFVLCIVNYSCSLFTGPTNKHPAVTKPTFLTTETCYYCRHSTPAGGKWLPSFYLYWTKYNLIKCIFNCLY